jgi:large subunit ribosomal protein L24
MKVRKGDMVLVLAGKDRGKRGTVERIERTTRGPAVVIPGINMGKKHQRAQGRTRQGGIMDVPMPIHASNVQVVCPRCDKPGRVRHATLDDGRRARVCRHCGEQIEVQVK